MQCTICYEPYDVDVRRPKIVPCGHTFCLHCLLRFQTSECPSCRTTFAWPPDTLTDNFLALEETADMKFVQRSLWCETCSEPPRAGCLEVHEVCSWRTAQSRLGGELAAALRAEQAALGRERAALAEMGAAFTAVVDRVAAACGAAAEAASSEYASVVSRPGAASHVVAKAMRAATQASESRAANVEDALSVLDATEAELKVKCDGKTLSFSLNLNRDDGDVRGSLDEAIKKSRLMLFTAFAMSRQLPPRVRTSSKAVVKVSVTGPGTGPLPYVTIEFDEMPPRMMEEWSKGWRRYQICRGCLESCHTQTFSPLPPDEDGVSVERGAVCLGRSSGKYYFILCRDMREKFCLPLAASFKVVGRVTKNLSSLDEVVRAITSAEQRVSIIPQRQRIRTSSVEY